VTLPEPNDLIDGTRQLPSIEEPVSIEDPNTGATLQPQRSTDADGVDRALGAAWDLHTSGEWQSTSVEEKAATLLALSSALEPRAMDVAQLESATSGATISTTAQLSFIVHAAFGLAAAQLGDGVMSSRMEGPAGSDVEVDRLGWGPAVLLCPWNAPAPMAAHKAASALAAGCPVIIKPPERAPHGTDVIGEVAAELGLPPGLVQVVHGGPSVGAALIGDERCRAVSFTGGVEGGRSIAHQCAEGLKPVQLELGGHAPLLIMDDAEIDRAVAAAVGLLTTLNGQWCRALGRLLLPEGRADEFLAAITDALADVVIGHSLDESSQMGPIVHSRHLDLLQARVTELEAEGGTAIAPATLPGGDLAGGNWMSPTLVTGVDPSNTDTEIFGPVAAVHTYSDIDDAIALANGTDYGLEAYVVGADEAAAMNAGRRINAGGVKVNGVSPISLNLMAPRPARGISGLYDEGTVETIHFFAGNRVVGVENSL
jgi:acyl-CoA reductase-like NAD-dependent aldehyde dehydrogenase